MRVLVNNDIIEVACSGCKSVLGVEVDDVMENDMSGRIWVNCMVCGVSIDVPLENIPKHWLCQIFEDDVHG